MTLSILSLLFLKVKLIFVTFSFRCGVLAVPGVAQNWVHSKTGAPLTDRDWVIDGECALSRIVLNNLSFPFTSMIMMSPFVVQEIIAGERQCCYCGLTPPVSKVERNSYATTEKSRTNNKQEDRRPAHQKFLQLVLPNPQKEKMQPYANERPLDHKQ